MNKNEKLYKKYAGTEVALDDGSTGFVCGYDNRHIGHLPLIMAIASNGVGWQPTLDHVKVVTHKDNPLGYYWVDPPKKESLWKRIVSLISHHN